MSTITKEVREGKVVQEILLLVKEKLLAPYQIEGLEQPISQITKSICNGKGITEQQMFENVQSYTVKGHADAILLPLITAIELSSIQYGETIPIVTVEQKTAEIDQPNVEHGINITSFEEGKAINTNLQQELVSSKNISDFSVKTDRVVSFDTPSEIQEPQVRSIYIYIFF